MERVMGIEPTSSAWEAEVLPLNYTRYTDSHQDYHRLAYFDQTSFSSRSPILFLAVLSDLYIGVFGLLGLKLLRSNPMPAEFPFQNKLKWPAAC
tara:strand:- start:226 stop:507 length:282 start_codon:yes stop_codon:yes gene_type:complete